MLFLVSAAEEAVFHHASPQQINTHRQGNEKQKLSQLKPARTLSFKARCLRFICHLNHPSPKSSDSKLTPPLRSMPILALFLSVMMETSKALASE
jgi:hypothetical protein